MAHDFQVFSQLIGYSPAEIDNPFFYKVFQLAPGGWWFCKEILPWWVVEFPVISIACLQIPPLCRGVGGGGGGGAGETND